MAITRTKYSGTTNQTWDKEIEQQKIAGGWIAKLFGMKECAIVNMLGLLMFVLLFLGAALSFFFGLDVLKLFIPLITAIAGYIAGVRYGP